MRFLKSILLFAMSLVFLVSCENSMFRSMHNRKGKIPSVTSSPFSLSDLEDKVDYEIRDTGNAGKNYRGRFPAAFYIDENYQDEIVSFNIVNINSENQANIFYYTYQGYSKMSNVMLTAFACYNHETGVYRELYHGEGPPNREADVYAFHVPDENKYFFWYDGVARYYDDASLDEIFTVDTSTLYDEKKSKFISENSQYVHADIFGVTPDIANKKIYIYTLYSNADIENEQFSAEDEWLNKPLADDDDELLSYDYESNFGDDTNLDVDCCYVEAMLSFNDKDELDAEASVLTKNDNYVNRFIIRGGTVRRHDYYFEFDDKTIEVPESISNVSMLKYANGVPVSGKFVSVGRDNIYIVSAFDGTYKTINKQWIIDDVIKSAPTASSYGVLNQLPVASEFNFDDSEEGLFGGDSDVKLALSNYVMPGGVALKNEVSQVEFETYLVHSLSSGVQEIVFDAYADNVLMASTIVAGSYFVGVDEGHLWGNNKTPQYVIGFENDGIAYVADDYAYARLVKYKDEQQHPISP